MRGKGPTGATGADGAGITPAYAGKSGRNAVNFGK